MADQRGTVAKKLASGQIEYTCPVCGGWDRLCEVYYSFLPFVDHLVQDICIMQHPMLSEPKIVEGELWFRVPGIRNLIPGLPRYSPDSPEWRELLGRNKKILPEAEIFLLDIGNWLEMALASIADLNTIQKSDLTTTESLVLLIGSLGAEFREQKDYLLQHQQTVADTGTDPKWLARPGNQARFVAHSMAGARWKLATSSSREMIRKSSPSSRKRAFQTLKISPREDWWIPEEKGE